MAALGERQFGRVSAHQLRRLGVPRQTFHNWLRTGYLHRVLPRVYAVGHRAGNIEAELTAALLYAGPGAMLSHATAAWWWGLVDQRPGRIEVSTPRRCRSLPGIRVHRDRDLERSWHRGMPVTGIAQTLLDYAASAPLTKVRVALAQADYQGILKPATLVPVLRRGRPGSARLRRALQRHMPQLGATKSRVERALLLLCEAGGLPLPEVNVRVAGWEVDAVWREQRIVVELDGWRNHRTPAQVNRDRRKEMELRAAGYLVLRYSEEQLVTQRRAVTHELRDLLHRSAPTGTRTERRLTRADRRGQTGPTYLQSSPR